MPETGSVDVGVNVDMTQLREALSVAQEFEATMKRVGKMASAIPDEPFDHSLAVARSMINPRSMGTATVPRAAVEEYHRRGLLDNDQAETYLGRDK